MGGERAARPRFLSFAPHFAVRDSAAQRKSWQRWALLVVVCICSQDTLVFGRHRGSTRLGLKD